MFVCVLDLEVVSVMELLPLTVLAGELVAIAVDDEVKAAVTLGVAAAEALEEEATVTEDVAAAVTEEVKAAVVEVVAAAVMEGEEAAVTEEVKATVMEDVTAAETEDVGAAVVEEDEAAVTEEVSAAVTLEVAAAEPLTELEAAEVEVLLDVLEAVGVPVLVGVMLTWKASSTLSTSSEDTALESPTFLTLKVRVWEAPAGSQAVKCSQPEVIMSPKSKTLRSATSCSLAAPLL